MYEQHLIQAGLTKEQAAVYETLVHQGGMQASIVARRAKIPRTFVYAVLSELQKLGLAESRKDKGSITTFSAAHPFKLQELARNQLRAAEQAKASVEGALAAIISDFNTTSGQPGIRILEGIEGLKDLYADILSERQPISLIRSPNDAKFPELKLLVEKQIHEQVRLKIRSRVITPLRPGSIADMLADDEKSLRTRRIIADDKFKPPAQVVVYGNKVAITAYNEHIITTIIENKDICATFRITFDYMWNAAELVHKTLIEKKEHSITE